MKTSCRVWFFRSGFACVLAFLWACADDKPGTVQVNYKLGPGSAVDCNQFGVQKLRARLGEKGPQAEAVCGAELIVREVDPGKYDLIVEGVDAEGVAIMDNSAAEPVSVAVSAGERAQEEVRLESRPATVYVRWVVKENNFPVPCSNPSVLTDRFAVVMWAAADRLLSVEYSCDAEATSGTYIQIEDEDRLIKGNTLDEVSIQPYESNDLSVGEPVRFQLGRTAGAGREVFLTLDCNDNICTALGTPPFSVRQ